ncbi:protein lin-37 homolog isoform X4 [Myotis lucifugus]|uniref:protein lin-37 homolog isoform X4 n=1 Tax=Myotis lucifugus TaxID=59463 RepID=UPI0003C4CBF6|nr:protein lin-37 homolog isoform X4 [Myotis lucifugus]
MGPHQRGARGAGGGGSRRPTLLRAEDLPRTKLIFDGLRLPLPLTCDARPFWAPLTQLARLQTQTMFPVKVKVEKSGSPRAGQSISPSVLPGSEHCAKAPTSWKRRANTSQELEMAKARNQLDAVLQCLLEKSHMDRDCSIVATGKRPSARFPHQRRKKRREMDDGLAEGGPQRSNTYVIKLFDRSVDLAQFSENTPLYPICRAWMRNSPTVREHERSPSSPLPPLPEDEEPLGHLEMPADPEFHPHCSLRHRVPLRMRWVCKVCLGLWDICCGAWAWPPSLASLSTQASEPSPSPSTLIYRNMQRWKRIRQRWKEASHRNQLRYSESMKILREMYERQ